MRIELKSNNTPKEEGYYLFGGSLGYINLLYVVAYKDMHLYGMYFPKYLGVANEGGRSIKQYSGKFSDKLEITI